MLINLGKADAGICLKPSSAAAIQTSWGRARRHTNNDIGIAEEPADDANLAGGTIVGVDTLTPSNFSKGIMNTRSR